MNAANKPPLVRLREWFRSFMHPHYCQRGEHRWIKCSMDGFVHCRDCWEHASVDVDSARSKRNG